MPYFIRALRKSDVQVSPAETLDAYAVLNQVGIQDKNLLKHSLGMALAKNLSEKEKFEETFSRFFDELTSVRPVKQSMVSGLETEELAGSLQTVLSTKMAHAVLEAVQGRGTELAHRLMKAGSDVNIQNIDSLREKSTFALALEKLLEIQALDDLDGKAVDPTAFRYLKNYLKAEISNFIDAQYRINVDPTAKAKLRRITMDSQLASIPDAYLDDLHTVVEQFAEKLVRRRKRKRRHQSVGEIDMPRTLRKNMAFDGTIFDVKWRRKKQVKATIYVLCDISGSVATVARFLLLLLFKLTEILPEIRAFVFSSELGEVTAQFRTLSAPSAIETALTSWGHGNTDYGRAFADFGELCMTSLSRRSTLIILGDGRSNFYDPNISTFRAITQRVGKTYWLNPEPQKQWDDGDSEMRKFGTLCTAVLLCNRLRHLERLVERLIKDNGS